MSHFEIIGYMDDNRILFKYCDKYIVLKPSLPKADLCFHLDEDARIIDREYRDKILNLARKGGLWGYRFEGKSGQIYKYEYNGREDKPLVGKWMKINDA